MFCTPESECALHCHRTIWQLDTIETIAEVLDRDASKFSVCVEELQKQFIVVVAQCLSRCKLSSFHFLSINYIYIYLYIYIYRWTSLWK